MLVAGGTDAADGYERATGRRPDDVALDFFRLTWDLKDLAEYLNVLRSPHAENTDTIHALGALANAAAIREPWAELL
jgi:spectinomycin phosphotransferase